MTDYQPQEVTAQAKAIAARYPTERTSEGGTQFGHLTPRVPASKRPDSPGQQQGQTPEASRRAHKDQERSHPLVKNSLGDWALGNRADSSDAQRLTTQRPALLLDDRNSVPKLKVRTVNELVIGSETVDLSAIEQLVEVGQVRAIGAAIAYLQHHYFNGITPLIDILTNMESDLNVAGIDSLTCDPQGDLVTFRILELAAVLNRLRSLSIQPPEQTILVKNEAHIN